MGWWPHLLAAALGLMGPTELLTCSDISHVRGVFSSASGKVALPILQMRQGLQRERKRERPQPVPEYWHVGVERSLYGSEPDSACVSMEAPGRVVPPLCMPSDKIYRGNTDRDAVGRKLDILDKSHCDLPMGQRGKTTK